MLPILVDTLVPRAVKAVTAAIATNVPANAYSTIVNPDSSCQKASNVLFKVFIMTFILIIRFDLLINTQQQLIIYRYSFKSE